MKIPVHRRWVLYTAPFLVWIVLQSILPANAAAYAVRSAATAAVGVLCFRLSSWRPTVPSLGTVAAGLVCGMAVAAVWILPESLSSYRTWFVWPFGADPAPRSPSPYEPAVCGWGLTLAKLAGSAFVIAPAEELFFRSFLYRRLQRKDFESVPLSHFDLSAFAWTVFMFMLEHDRPVAAMLAGVAYGIVAVRFSIGAAVVAHVATNLILAIHVIRSGAWGFW